MPNPPSCQSTFSIITEFNIVKIDNLYSQLDEINYRKLKLQICDNFIDNMKRDYFSVRNGQQPSTISLEHIVEIIIIQYNEFKNKGYFQYYFGYDCVDAGFVSGQNSLTLEKQLMLTFGSKSRFILPIPENLGKFDLFSLFDLIEFLYDHTVKPIDPNRHRYNNCGIHINFNSVDFNLGKDEWRTKVNEYLPHLEFPYTMNKDGKIIEIPSSEGLQHLINHNVSHDAAETIDDRVKHACSLFLKGNSTINNKRDALKNLADVLELLRADIKSYTPNYVERRLFEIANTFGIRHHNEQQNIDYNQEIYFYWIFYSYLSVIDLLGRLKKIK